MRAGGQAGIGRAWARVLRLGPFAAVVLLVVVVLQAQTSPEVATPHQSHDPSGGHASMGGMRMASVSSDSYAAVAPDLPARRTTRRADGATSVLTVDLRQVQTVSGLRYAPRSGGAGARRTGRYRVQTSVDGRRWTPAVTGVWADDAATRTAAFAPTRARFVRLSTSGARAVSAREVTVQGAPLGAPLDRTGWTASADAAETSDPAASAIDGDPGTHWHSPWATSAPALPHQITLDTLGVATISALSYTPRQDGSANGRIGAYVVETSTDRATWTQVAAGTWADDAATKAVQFTPVRARYVRLRATTEAGGRGPWSSAAEINLYGLTTGPALDPADWSATADSASAGEPATRAVDGSTATFWHTPYGADLTPLPHTLTIDTHGRYAVTGLSYTPRQDGGANGTVGGYRVEVSTDGTTWSAPVASGTWPDDRTTKVTAFGSVTTRWVRLVALTEAGGRGAWTSAAEVGLFGYALGPALDTASWTVSADSASAAEPAVRAVDGNRATFWHTPYGADLTALPHTLTIDTHGRYAVTGLSYLPRQDGSPNGTIGRYRVEVSDDGTTWSGAVAAGAWVDDRTAKTAAFGAVTTRYVRLVAVSEAGGRGSWTSAAEVGLFGVPTGPVIDPAGWSATADSAAAGEPPTRVLDGDAGSIWHTPYGADLTPLPHTLTIDTRGRYVVNGLSYTPRQDATPNGTVGRYRIQVSADGTTWSAPVASGTWADDRTTKTAAFADVTARYVRLVALSEAGGRGQWTSAAEVRLRGTAADPGTLGSWGPVIGLPIVPTSAILLPNNKVLTFSAFSPTAFDYTTPYTQVSIIDVSAADGGRPGQRRVSNTGHQMFCTGLSVLADGRVLITGGSGPSNSTLYDPATDTFTAAPDMAVPRGYQTSVTLSNGKVFTIGGSWSGAVGGKGAEVLSADATAWSRLTGVTADSILTDDREGVYRSDNHAWLFAGSGGRVFHAGPSDQMNWFTTTGSGTATPAGERGDAPDQMNGNAVMYDAGRILTLGGSPSYQDSEATAGAWTIDITGGAAVAPVVTRQGDLAEPRAFTNSVVLPDGSVLTTGGQRHAQTFTDTTATRTAELWNPATGLFRTLAPEAIPRTYHSFSLLLADGRVLSGGGGLCGDCTVNHPDVQVFTPPYLLNADGSPRSRPVITGTVPATLPAGTGVRVTADRPVASWALVRTGTATHSINSDQRRFTVPATRVGTTSTYDLVVPADRGTSVPGTYLLFALDASGTPSLARWVRIPL